MTFSQEELRVMANDPRPKVPLKRRKPSMCIAGRRMAKLVAEETGFQIVDVKAILAAFYSTASKELLNKKVVEIPGVCSMYAVVKPSRVCMSFNGQGDKNPTKMISQPKFTTMVNISHKMEEKVKKLEVNKQDIEDSVYTKKR